MGKIPPIGLELRIFLENILNRCIYQQCPVILVKIHYVLINIWLADLQYLPLVFGPLKSLLLQLITVVLGLFPSLPFKESEENTFLSSQLTSQSRKDLKLVRNHYTHNRSCYMRSMKFLGAQSHKNNFAQESMQ